MRANMAHLARAVRQVGYRRYRAGARVGYLSFPVPCKFLNKRIVRRRSKKNPKNRRHRPARLTPRRR
jgi:hypothetical protein